MSVFHGLAPDQRDLFLRQAARERALLTLAVRDGKDWKTYKARLLGLRQNPASLLVEYPSGSGGERAPDLGEGQLMGVGFRRGQRKCLFTAMVIAKERVTVGPNSHVGAAVLRWPEEMQELQRRAYERVDVPPSWEIEVDFWGREVRLNPRRSPPPPLFWGRLANLSAGGLAVQVPESVISLTQVDEVYVCMFAPEKHHPPFSVQALLRHQTGCDGSGNVRLGFQFLGLEFNPRMLSRLARVVSQFQRYHPNPRRGDSE